MKACRSWPPYLSPAWIAAYGVGALAWFGLYELWGACLVVAVLAGGALAIHALGELLATGHALPEERDR